MSRLHNLRHQRQAAGAPASYPLAPGYGAAPPAGPYYPAPGPYYGGNPQMMMQPVQWLGGAPGMNPDQQYQNLQAEEHRHKQNEHRAEMGALGTAAFAAYEKHQEKVDPAHAQRHHMEVQAAEAATLGLGVYALHEHHEAHKMHKAEKHERHHHKHDHHHRH
ncbi:unnamed protein product [Sphagnum jensenii]|uniref:Uncharacterized protein n=1 Tax=Sphagnum jensenii TaxID=128206 RepID=A0ABP1A532_9BRYO